MKALPISVYRDSNGGDCTNGGISGKHRRLLLVCDDGYIEVDENNPPENLVVLQVKHFGFGTFRSIRPYKDADQIGWMYGGNIAYSSDSRFRELCGDYPLPIHDRQESQELSDILSR